jgi:hypothetical protein
MFLARQIQWSNCHPEPVIGIPKLGRNAAPGGTARKLDVIPPGAAVRRALADSQRATPRNSRRRAKGSRAAFRLSPGSPQLLSSLRDDPIIEILIHEEPDCSQSVQLRPDLGQETALLARHEETDRSNHPETQRCGKPSRRLFIQNEQRGSQLQTQTDDLTFSWTNGTAHRNGLERMCQLLDQDPVGQFCHRWLHFPCNGRRNADAGVKPAQQIEPTNLSKRD